MTLTRRRLRALFPDGKWRTVEDVASLLDDSEIPNEEAARIALTNPSAARLPLDERIRAGRRMIVRNIINSMHRRDTGFEKRLVNGVKEFRFLPKADDPPTTPAHLTISSMKLAETAKSGLTSTRLLRYIADHPGCELPELVKELASYVDDKYALGLFRKHAAPRGGRFARINDIPLDQLGHNDVARGKAIAIATKLHGWLCAKGIRKQTAVKYFIVGGDEETKPTKKPKS